MCLIFLKKGRRVKTSSSQTIYKHKGGKLSIIKQRCCQVRNKISIKQMSQRLCTFNESQKDYIQVKVDLSQSSTAHSLKITNRSTKDNRSARAENALSLNTYSYLLYHHQRACRVVSHFLECSFRFGICVVRSDYLSCSHPKLTLSNVRVPKHL